jgi:RNA polymerase sigma-70 factor (ECF subfamily)
MAETSVSLLEQLRRDPDERAWHRLVDLCTPLIRGWLRQFPGMQNDADDVVQETLTVVLKKIAGFERERTGSFRRWLRQVTVNCLRDHWRKCERKPTATGDTNFQHTLDQLEDPHSNLSQLWDREHTRHVTHYLLEQIRSHFEPTTWQAFQRVALDGAAPADVARELGVTVNAVFIAKSRVMTLLRQHGEGLLD